MGDVRLSLPRLRVTLDTDDVLELQVLNPDMLRWDDTARLHKWGKGTDSPNKWLTFLAWAAATRTRVTTAKWEDWASTVCLQVESVDDDQAAAGDQDDDQETDPGTPTPPGPGPG